MITTHTHYMETGKERAKRYNSTGHYNDGCLCLNGSFHAVKVRIKAIVDCPVCLEILATNPPHLASS